MAIVYKFKENYIKEVPYYQGEEYSDHVSLPNDKVLAAKVYASLINCSMSSRSWKIYYSYVKITIEIILQNWKFQYI